MSTGDICYSIKPTGDAEVDCLQLILLAMRGIDDEARRRVAPYIADRFKATRP